MRKLNRSHFALSLSSPGMDQRRFQFWWEQNFCRKTTKASSSLWKIFASSNIFWFESHLFHHEKTKIIDLSAKIIRWYARSIQNCFGLLFKSLTFAVFFGWFREEGCCYRVIQASRDWYFICFFFTLRNLSHSIKYLVTRPGWAGYNLPYSSALLNKAVSRRPIPLWNCDFCLIRQNLIVRNLPREVIQTKLVLCLRGQHR